MRKDIGKTLLGVLLLKTAFVAGWYVYEKYCAEWDKEDEPHTPTTEDKAVVQEEVVTPVAEVKSAPAKKVVVKRAKKVVKDVAEIEPVVAKKRAPRKTVKKS